MRLLIAVISCHKNATSAPVIRQTWAKSSLADVKFFYGQGAKRMSQEDEIFLDVPDTYEGLPYKVQGAFRYALSQGYTHCFKCDDDVYLRPERIVSAGYEGLDYVGAYKRIEDSRYPNGFMHGGAGYCLSMKALNIISQSQVDQKSEDGWVANKLFEKGISGNNDSRLVWIRRVYKDPYPEVTSTSNDVILSGEFTPEEMVGVHHRWANPVDPTEAMSADEYKAYLRFI